MKNPTGNELVYMVCVLNNCYPLDLYVTCMRAYNVPTWGCISQRLWSLTCASFLVAHQLEPIIAATLETTDGVSAGVCTTTILRLAFVYIYRQCKKNINSAVAHYNLGLHG